MKINDFLEGRRLAVIPLQLMRIMKITILIMTIFLMQVSASTKAQITLKENGISLQKALKSISKQSGYDFIYSIPDLKDTKPLNIKLENVSIEKALQVCFDGQPLVYEISDKTVMVKRKEDKTVIEKSKVFLVSVDVKGKIVDDKGQPLAGVTIKLKDESQVTITDKDGNFLLRKVNDNAVIVISSIGYLTKEINAKAELGTIQLEVSSSKLDEIQIIAYGTTSQRLNTGNISSVKAADIEKQPVSNPLLALEGRVPSLQITQNTGLPGSGVTVRIQGINSLSKGKSPFYVVDGVPYISDMPANLGQGILGSDPAGLIVNGVGNGGGSPLNYISPADIESVEVLKDADATAIYGSRAANGAILITTKKGKTGQTKVDLNMQQGIGEVSHFVPMMNTQQYLQFRRDAILNDGQTVPNASTAPSNTNYDFTIYDQNKTTNWQKELLGGKAIYTDVQAAISGGSELTTFRVNGGYHRETTVFPGSSSDIKGSFGFHINHSSANRKFTLQASGSYLTDNNSLPQTDLTSLALNIQPNAPGLYKPDGSLNWQRIPSAIPGADSVSTRLNPLSYLNNSYSSKTNNLIANTTISYSILPGLLIKSSFGYTNLTNNEVTKNPLTSYAPELREFNSRFAGYGRGNVQSWIAEPQINYNRTFDRSKFDILVGTTFQSNSSSVLLLGADGFSSDQVMDDIQSAPNISVLNTVENEYKYTALFGRVNYNWSDKYIVNITARRDGSSRFGEQNRFHDFGAVGAAWLFSNESFFKSIKFISFGKLRGSYGTTGNDQIGDYQYLSLYKVPSNIQTSYQGTAGLVPQGLTNPYLQWELTRKMQLGLDLGLLNDRIIISANFYHNQSSNQLISYSLPSTTGFSSIVQNLPATIENTGWELSLNSNNIRGKKIKWTSSINITIPRNKLVRFDNLASSVFSDVYIVGQPVDIKKTYSLAGVNPQTGTYQFYKADGSLTATPSANDNIFVYSPSPKLYGGIQNSISYGDLSLDFLFQFVKQKGVNILGSYTSPGFSYGAPNLVLGNLPEYYLDYWKKPGDVASIAKPTSALFSNNDVRQSNFAVSDASFIRLKNLSLSYSAPKKWKEAINAQNLRLFIQGQNLLIFSNYKGLDPENQSGTSLSPLRVIVLGLQVTF